MTFSTPAPNNAIRVMIVDDSAFMRKALERILTSSNDIMICDSVSSGEMALERLKISKPDLITMDVEMPGMGGLAAVRAITAQQRVPIVMLSSLTSHGTDSTIQALQNGASDFVTKPTGGALEISKIAAELVEKIRTLGRREVRSWSPATVIAPVAPIARTIQRSPANAHKRRAIDLVAIGISTGGPAALSAVMSALPADAKVPIMVVQHMPAGFTKALADRLNTQCTQEVVEAVDQMPLQAGQVVIGVAGKQMRLRRVGGKYVVAITESQNESLYTPSADVLFKSVAEVCGRSAVGIIMTGMGNDGTEGLKDLKAAGGYVYGQDEGSCVVYGMPRAAAVAGVVDAVIPLNSIAEAIHAASQGAIL